VGAIAYRMRGYATSNIQLELLKGGVSTSIHGNSSNWYQGYNERVTQFNITATTNVYTFSMLLSNGVQKQATLQTNTSHFTINGGILQLNAAIATQIANGNTAYNWGHFRDYGLDTPV